jgi:hypothetical protein
MPKNAIEAARAFVDLADWLTSAMPEQVQAALTDAQKNADNTDADVSNVVEHLIEAVRDVLDCQKL